MNKSFPSFFHHLHLPSSLSPNLILVVGILCTTVLVQVTQSQLQRDTEKRDKERLYHAKSRLELSLHERLNVAYSLEAFVKTSPYSALKTASQKANFKKSFLQYADALTARTKGLLSIQLAPQAVVSYLTQEERNKAAIGHDLLMDPKRRKQTLRTILGRKLIIAGPIHLRQGGTAFIARLAIFSPHQVFKATEYLKQRNLKESPDWLHKIPRNFWGLAIVLLDVKTFYQVSGFVTMSENTEFALRGRHGMGERGDVFLGKKSVFTQPTAKVKILLPTGQWVLASCTPLQLTFSFFFKILISLGITLLLYKLLINQKMQIESQAASDVKDAILANMSHELRTPLTAIVGLSESILAQSNLSTPHTKDEVELRDEVELIRRNALKMATMVNDVVDMADIDVGNLKLQTGPFELRTELDSLSAHMKPQAESYHAEFVDPVINFDTLHVLADRKRIRQILTKLIDNAIRFSNRGKVETEYLVISRSPGYAQVRFLVKDNGVGIDKEKQLLLFRAFVKKDLSDTKQHGGLGIGLSISQAIIKLMDSQLKIDSTKGAGSTISFTLNLPLSPAQETNYILPSFMDLPAPTESYLRQALIVDDNPINCAVLAAAASSFGFETDTAFHGQEAVQKASQNHYDLILMDCQMPVMDGYEATQLIRQEQADSNGNKRSFIIACTANALAENRDRCLEAGMDDFLVKPVQRNALKNMLTRHGALQ